MLKLLEGATLRTLLIVHHLPPILLVYTVENSIERQYDMR